MSKRALIVGIDKYDCLNPLAGCVADATEMAELLSRHDDGSVNFDCRLLTSPGPSSITKGNLRRLWGELFDSFTGDVLFYFSGHGTPTSLGGYLVTQDGTLDDPGLAMNDVLTLANKSQAQSVLLILDCCFSGSMGNPPNLQGDVENQAQLREGVTVLAASRPTQPSLEVGNHGVFTNLVIGAYAAEQRTSEVGSRRLHCTRTQKLHWVLGSSDRSTNHMRTASILFACVTRG